MAITLATGEALTGDGNELAHIDLSARFQERSGG